MTNAGIALPAWTSSVLLDVSADGSTVVGSYITGQDPDVAPQTGFYAVLPAANDTCETARVVSYGTVVGATLGATRAGVSGNCHSEGTAPDVWYVFTPAANETVNIETCGSSFDTTLTLFRANTCGALLHPSHAMTTPRFPARRAPRTPASAPTSPAACRTTSASADGTAPTAASASPSPPPTAPPTTRASRRSMSPPTPASTSTTPAP